MGGRGDRGRVLKFYNLAPPLPVSQFSLPTAFFFQAGMYTHTQSFSLSLPLLLCFLYGDGMWSASHDCQTALTPAAVPSPSRCTVFLWEFGAEITLFFFPKEHLFCQGGLSPQQTNNQGRNQPRFAVRLAESPQDDRYTWPCLAQTVRRSSFSGKPPKNWQLSLMSQVSLELVAS